MIKTKRTKHGGRKSDPSGPRGTLYHFRVNPAERKLLDLLGKPYQLRKMLVYISMVRVGMNGGLDFNGRTITLKDIDLEQLVNDVREDRLGKNDDETT